MSTELPPNQPAQESESNRVACFARVRLSIKVGDSCPNRENNIWLSNEGPKPPIQHMRYAEPFTMAYFW